MKNTLVVFIASLLAFDAFAKADVNQVVADTVRSDVEIRAVVKAISDARGIKCNAPSGKETTVGKISSLGAKFSAVYSCNEYDHNGQPQANVQQIIIKGTAYHAAHGKVGINFQGLDIVEFE